MTTTGENEWDAGAYHALADPQEEWGREVLDRLTLAGDETVLDAGCGSGRLTALLLERLPRGRVVGVDASFAMIDKARETLGDDARVELIASDLLDLELPEPVDAIYSNAALHWILDHQKLFARLHAASRPGARLEAQFGGEGNVAEWERAVDSVSGDERFTPYLRGMRSVWNFASVGDTETRLERAGFQVERIWLEPRAVTPSDPREFVRVVGLSRHLAKIPPELQDEFIGAILESMMEPLRLDYVRLNVSARRKA